MESKGSLPFSQECTSSPYLESVESSPHPQSLLLFKIPLYYYPPMYASVFEVVFSFQVLQLKLYPHFSSLFNAV